MFRLKIVNIELKICINLVQGYGIQVEFLRVKYGIFYLHILFGKFYFKLVFLMLKHTHTHTHTIRVAGKSLLLGETHTHIYINRFVTKCWLH